MVFSLRQLLLLFVSASVVYIATSKHAHKKSHGPLRPSKGKKAYLKGHHLKHRHVIHHKIAHINHHLRHKIHHLEHKHQPALHLKAHKKGVTYAELPSPPSACYDYLLCSQYRYYHCYYHEWIRNMCPKLCHYCDHQPYADPMNGRFKVVSASYADECVDDHQCVTYRAEACAYDPWMQLHCPIKCETCQKDMKVQAGLLMVGPPYDQTEKDKKTEDMLNKILKFRPTPAPGDVMIAKLNADKDKSIADETNKTSSSVVPTALSKPLNVNPDVSAGAAQNSTSNLQTKSTAANAATVSGPNLKPSSDSPVNPVTSEKPVTPIKQVTPLKTVTPEHPTTVNTTTVSHATPGPSSDLPTNQVAPAKPVAPVRPVSSVKPITPEKPTIATTATNPRPNPEPSSYSPANPVTKPDFPVKPYSPVVQQQNLAVGKVETKPKSEAGSATVVPPTFNLDRQKNTKNSVGVPAYSYHDLVKQELQAAKEAPSTKQFKADVLKDVQIKLNSGNIPSVSTTKAFAKHKVSKPKKEQVEPKKRRAKPENAHKKNKNDEKKIFKHFREEKAKTITKEGKLHEAKVVKDEKQRNKMNNESIKVKKQGERKRKLRVKDENKVKH